MYHSLSLLLTYTHASDSNIHTQVQAWELPDGIAIRGRAATSSQEDKEMKRIFCYNDHRIAMSFAVLSSRIPNILILDKECTDKTFPHFWDHAVKLGLALKTPDHVHSATHTIMQMRPQVKIPRVVLLIGMRCSGKSSLARYCAKVDDKNWRCVDVDEELQKRAKMSVKEYVKKNGWDKFRDLESETLEIVLRDAHNTKTKRTIVACGGGIVETERSRKLLERERHSTIYIRRHPDDVDSELNGHDEGGTALRPSYSGGESVRVVRYI